MCQIKKVTLHHIRMNLKNPFTTSYGSYTERDLIITEIQDNDGIIGWGEGVAFSTPWYTEETVKTSWHMMEDFLIPFLFNKKINHPSELVQRYAIIKRNQMAKAAIEQAVWDLYAKKQNKSLSNVIGGSRKAIEAGVAIGIQPKDTLLKTIEERLEEGYKRLKVKIKPDQDYKLLKDIRTAFPNVPLMADANSAYSLADMDRLKSLDEFQLMMIEQPLASDDIIDHARLQSELKTPICLDESIVTYADARKAIEIGSCQVINIKIGRVGGITEAKRIHDLCQQKGVPVWCGGMLETGIGRAHNIALASLPNFQLPGDISASSRYWYEDIVYPEFHVEDGMISVPNQPGIGVTVDRQKLQKYTVSKKTFVNQDA